MAELLVVGSIWFWLFIVAEIAILFACVGSENGFGATISLVVFGAILQFASGVDILGLFWNHPTGAGAFLVSYFLFGIAWATFKWWVYCRDQKVIYDERKRKWLDLSGHFGVERVPEELQKEWYTYCVGHSIQTEVYIRDHKSKYMRWMSFWFVSVIHTFCYDFVARVWRHIYNLLTGFLQEISNRIFASTRDDFKSLERKHHSDEFHDED
jgi:hypothetical protein